MADSQRLHQGDGDVPSAPPAPLDSSEQQTQVQAQQITRVWRSAAIGALSLTVALGLLGFIWLFARPLALILIAIVIGEALAPIVAWLSKRLPRTLSVVLVYLTLAVLFGVLAWFTISPLVDQIEDFVEQVPALLTQVQTFLDQQSDVIDEIPIGNGESLSDIAFGQVEFLLGQAAMLPMQLMSALFDVIIVVFLSLYWLLASPALLRFTLSLFPKQRRERAREVLGEMGQTMGGYVRGVAINALVVATATYIGLLIIGVEFPLVLAVLAGSFEVVPVLGPFLSGTIIVVVALFDSLTTGLIALAFVLVLQQIEGNILTPYVMNKQTHVHPLMVLTALVLGGSIGGLLGALVAIPLAGAIFVLTKEVLAPAVRNWSGNTL